MITAALQGGLGNQLFQIAAITSLAIDNNDSPVFDLGSCYTPLQGHSSLRYKDNILKNVVDSWFDIRNIVAPPEFPYTPLVYTPLTCYRGYFQSEKYFSHNENSIKQLFDIAPLYFTSKYTTLHIRRGDYLKNPQIHSPCSLDYYKEAMTLTSGPVFVFSDDIEWAKHNLTGDRLHFVDNKDEIESFRLMLGATDSIISNSSFSWWGAWLRRNAGKTIAPKIWFGPDGPDYSDVVPDHWIKI